MFLNECTIPRRVLFDAALKRRLKKSHAKLPIEHFFVNSNPKTIISSDPGSEHLLHRACNNEILLDKVSQAGKPHRKTVTEQSSLIKLGQAIIAAYIPPQYSIQKEYQISIEEILPGVHCPICFSIPMLYARGTWHCSNCKHQSKRAHIDTINDNFLLIKPTITNSELRHFLDIPNIYIANEILKSLELPYIGNNSRGRVYMQPQQ